jgi:hypothetical protein
LKARFSRLNPDLLAPAEERRSEEINMDGQDRQDEETGWRAKPDGKFQISNLKFEIPNLKTENRKLFPSCSSCPSMLISFSASSWRLI